MFTIAPSFSVGRKVDLLAPGTAALPVALYVLLYFKFIIMFVYMDMENNFFFFFLFFCYFFLEQSFCDTCSNHPHLHKKANSSTELHVF